MGPKAPNDAKYFLKIFPIALSVSCQSFISERFMVQNIHSKMYPASYPNHGVIRIEVDAVFENVKKLSISLTELEFFIK